MKRSVCLLFLCLSCARRPSVDCAANATGYFMTADFWCAMYSRERTHVEYLVDWHFNEEFVMQYNSTVGKWTGFTPAGSITASLFNGDFYDAQQRIVEKQLICVDHVDVIFNVTEESIVHPPILDLSPGSGVSVNSAEPVVTLVESTSSSKNMLVCSAYDFYPRNIRMTWLRNGQEVTSGVTFSDVLTNGDWTYQAHSYLEYTPTVRQDRVSCMVEHSSLREPKIYDRDLNQSERRLLIGGVCFLVLGAVFLSLGLIQYRRKRCDSRCSTAL